MSKVDSIKRKPITVPQYINIRSIDTHENLLLSVRNGTTKELVISKKVGDTITEIGSTTIS